MFGHLHEPAQAVARRLVGAVSSAASTPATMCSDIERSIIWSTSCGNHLGLQGNAERALNCCGCRPQHGGAPSPAVLPRGATGGHGNLRRRPGWCPCSRLRRRTLRTAGFDLGALAFSTSSWTWA